MRLSRTAGAGVITGIAVGVAAMSVSADQVTIRYLEIPGAHESTSQHIVDLFNEAHPDIHVVYKAVGGDYATAIKANTIAGTVDVFWAGDAQIQDWSAQGIVKPLDALLKADPDLNRQIQHDMVPSFVESLTVDGHLYALPKDGSPLVMYYNSDMFDAAGVSYPQSSWTWNDFVPVAKKLTVRGTDGRFTQEGYQPTETGINSLAGWIFSAGGRLMQPSGIKSALTEPEALQALKFVHSIYSDDQIVSPDGGLNFGAGTAAMIISGVWSWQGLDSAKVPYAWNVQVLPRGEAGSISVALSGAFAISTATKHPKAAWEVIKYLSGEEAQLIRATDRQSFPSLLSVARETFLQPAGSIDVHAFLSAVLSGHPLNLGSRRTEIQTLIAQKLNPIWSNQVSVIQGATQADQAIAALYAK